jgi:hypothetical protein
LLLQVGSASLATLTCLLVIVFISGGNGEDAACKLPHLDALLWLDGDGSRRRLQGVELGSGFGPRSRLGVFYSQKLIFGVGTLKLPTLQINLLVSVNDSRHHKPLIFCIVLIISFSGADTKNDFSTHTTIAFCISVH